MKKIFFGACSVFVFLVCIVLIKTLVKSFSSKPLETYTVTLPKATKDTNLWDNQVKKMHSMRSPVSYCLFSSKSSVKAKGLNIDIYFPCNWTPVDNPIPSTVKQFLHNITDSCAVLITFSVNPITLSEKVFKEQTTGENLIKVAKKYGDYISAKNIIIDGRSGDQILVKNKKDNIFTYNLTNHFYIDGNMVTIGYSVSTYNEKLAKETLENNTMLFKTLLSKTVFH